MCKFRDISHSQLLLIPEHLIDRADQCRPDGSPCLRFTPTSMALPPTRHQVSRSCPFFPACPLLTVSMIAFGSRIIGKFTYLAILSSGGSARFPSYFTSLREASSSYARSEATKTYTTVSLTFHRSYGTVCLCPRTLCSYCTVLRPSLWLPLPWLGDALFPLLHYAAPAFPTSLPSSAVFLHSTLRKRL